MKKPWWYWVVVPLYFVVVVVVVAAFGGPNWLSYVFTMPVAIVSPWVKWRVKG